MTVAVLRLTSGEELICRIKAEEEGFYVVSDPHVIHIQRGPQGTQLGFFPFMMYASGHEIKILAGAIGCVAIPDERMEQAYVQQTDPTAIIVPEKPSIIVP